MSGGKVNPYLLSGTIGSMFFFISDFIMMYGDPTPLSTKVYFLTKGTFEISGWVYNMSMILGCIGAIFMGIGLFSLESSILESKHRKTYHILNIINIAHWLLLHFTCIVVLYVFHFTMTHGYESTALPIAEALFSQFLWIAVECVTFMVPAFAFFLWLHATGRTSIPRYMLCSHFIVFIILLSSIDVFIPPNHNAKLGFRNAIGNISCFFYFLCLFIHSFFTTKTKKQAKTKFN